MAAAAVSALTLRTWPSTSRSGATVETTGTRPASRMSRTAEGLTLSTSPTRPRSTSSPSTTVPRRRAPSRPASSPDSPTAIGPCWLSSPTSSRPTWPVSTIRTTSMTSGVVTRRPPLNSLSRPTRSSIALICGPPPCTTTGRRPAYRRKATSSAKAALRASSTMALPPYFTTTREPRKRSSQGRASTSVDALPAATRRAAASMRPRRFCWAGVVVMCCRPSSRGRSRA